MATSDLTALRLRELLHYDQRTGVFTRLMRTASRSNVGDVAGSLNRLGYCIISVDCRPHYAHRLAWLHVHGHWPAVNIDHINGDRSDNRIANLREATQAENLQNQRAPHRDSKSNCLGVRWDKNRQKWKAEICVKGRRIHIGRFATEAAAADAYIAAKREYHPFGTTKEELCRQQS